MRDAQRVWLTPAYVLHHYAYRDTSRILEAFTAEHGRLSLFARGVAGPKSKLGAVLRPFQRLLISWSGRSDACRLVGAEVDGPAASLPPSRLMSGFYLNELLLKLTERGDPNPRVFACYAEALQALAAQPDQEACLRRFEKRLLDELGYGLQLTCTEEGRPIEPTMYYRIEPQGGPRACVAEAPGAVYGRSLAELDAEAFSDARSLRDAKRVLRAAIDSCLDGRPLNSRQILAQLHRGRQA
ncbi:MAG TPA: DNA repair protein RecO [Steroidobacteraceae bacterium]|nr:DNA repair protein RecO [Steroidobacteraceae bacterium]